MKETQGRRDLLREKTNGPIFTIEEIGLTNRQVAAAAARSAGRADRSM